MWAALTASAPYYVVVEGYYGAVDDYMLVADCSYLADGGVDAGVDAGADGGG